jgi:hypothetical protein
MLIRLRTGHAPLNKHLHVLKLRETPGCNACEREEEETVRHFLLDCPAHEGARRTLRAKLGARKAGELRFLLSDKRAMAALVTYVDQTQRFAETLGTIANELPVH